MSFFSSKPQHSGAAVQRKKQVDSLRARNQTIRLTKENTYRINITTQFGPLPLGIYLPPQFPSVPPQIRLILAGSVVHPWIDNQMMVSNHPSILRWSVHTDVGALVKQICEEFARSPPKPAQMKPTQPRQPVPRTHPGQGHPGMNQVRPGMHQGHPGRNQGNPGMNQGRTVMQPVPAPNPLSKPKPRTKEPSNHQFHVPNIPLPSFSAIEKKTPAELQIFCLKKELRYQFMLDLEEVKNLENVKATLYDGIEKIAKENLSHESEIKEKVAELKELREQVERKKKEYEPYGEKKQKILEKFTYKSIMKALDDAIEEHEELSDKTRERYENIDNSDSDSNSDDDEKEVEELTHTKFTKIYTKERKKTHVLLAKKERLITLYGQP